jgi:diacylglycerol kinase (ATP)
MQISNQEYMQINFEYPPKTYVVINPVSGTLQPDVVRETIQSALQAHNVAFEIYETTGKENVRQLVRDAVQHGFELFLAVGGDGTAAAVASGLVNTQIPLAVIPTGTWNALARNLDIPLPIDQALELVFEAHRIRVIDAMQVGDNVHILNISTGIGARTMRESKREEKRRFGVFADLWVALNNLMGFQTYHFDVRIDGKQSKFRALEVMVANSKIIGLKGIQLDPEIHMDDGKLNVCRLYADNLIDFFNLAISILLGKQRQSWNILCLDALHEVEIRCREKSLPVQGDGDLIGRLPIVVKLRPKALHIVVPMPTV